MDKQLAECQRVIGYHFTTPNLLEVALTHSSLRTPDRECNERLEFLGDSVLGLVVTEELYRLLPDQAEGELTRIKSAVVSRGALYRASTDLGLARFAEFARGVGRRNELPVSVIANLVESVIGAIYLDAGYYPAREFVLRHLGPVLDDVLNDRGAKNYKSLLQHEVQQGAAGTPVYRTLDEGVPDHRRKFTVAVLVAGREWGRAQGRTKKEAEQDAARRALEAWQRRGRGRRRRRGEEREVAPSVGAAAPAAPVPGSAGGEGRRRGRRGGRSGRPGPGADLRPAAPAEPAALREAGFEAAGFEETGFAQAGFDLARPPEAAAGTRPARPSPVAPPSGAADAAPPPAGEGGEGPSSAGASRRRRRRRAPAQQNGMAHPGEVEGAGVPRAGPRDGRRDELQVGPQERSQDRSGAAPARPPPIRQRDGGGSFSAGLDVPARVEAAAPRPRPASGSERRNVDARRKAAHAPRPASDGDDGGFGDGLQ